MGTRRTVTTHALKGIYDRLVVRSLISTGSRIALNLLSDAELKARLDRVEPRHDAGLHLVHLALRLKNKPLETSISWSRGIQSRRNRRANGGRHTLRRPLSNNGRPSLNDVRVIFERPRMWGLLF